MNYLIIGFGIVGRNLIEFLEGDIVVIDTAPFQVENTKIKEFVRERVTADNYQALCQKYTSEGDIVIDTAVELDTADICLWCYCNKRYYVNTVCDMWKYKTLRLTHNLSNIDNLLEKYVAAPIALARQYRTGTTCLMGHGANIGMVNHFFKAALQAKAVATHQTLEATTQSVSEVYVVEKDTLNFALDFEPDSDTFYNTWNILEFLMESCALPDYPAPNGIVTSDKPIVRDVFMDNLCLKGRVVSHEETFTIANYLVNKGVNRKKVQFLYECSPIGEISRVKHPFGSTYKTVVGTTELATTEGYDLVGIIIIFEDGTNWFYGYKMEQAAIEQTSRTNATAWFVSSGVLTAVDIIRKYPNLGINFPEDLDIAINQSAISYFSTLNNPAGLISKEIKNLFISDEYSTYKVRNLHKCQNTRYRASEVCETIIHHSIK